MKNKVIGISLVVLSLLSACNTPITKLETENISNTTNFNLKLKLSGKAEFPKSNLGGLKTKATFNDITANATVSLIYPSEHLTSPNQTIATGITNNTGNFTINFNTSFLPKTGEIFVLEASKRLGGSGNALMSIRTYVKWNGSSWDSITSPSIFINSKTTALSAMSGLLGNTVSSLDTIGSMKVVNDVTTPSDIKKDTKVLIKGDSIIKTASLVEYALTNNYDPLQYLVYEKGAFSLKEPNIIVNKITTVAGGADSIPFENINATDSRLSTPTSIDFDNVGNLYIADSGHGRIRKVDKTTGIITTIAGNGIQSYSGDGGLSTNAQLNYPNGLSFDSTGNIYIADTGNNRIRKIDKVTKIISTVVGNGNYAYSGDGGAASNATLMNPTRISFDSIDNMYISDSYSRIRKIDKVTGIITTLAGGGNSFIDGGQASNTSLSNPLGVAFDSNDNMYIADSGNGRIRKVDKTTGIISTIVGGGLFKEGDSPTNTYLYSPSDITFDSLGNLFITDTNNYRIRKVDKTTNIISTIVGNGVYGYSGDGDLATKAQLSYPNSLSFDLTGNMYVVDTSNYLIRKIDKTTNVISTIAGGGVGDNIQATLTKLDYPQGINCDSNGNIYIADTFNKRIRKIDKMTGIISTVVGNGFFGYSGDGDKATNAKLYSPIKISFDSLGNIYIVDLGNNVIRKVDKTTGIISTVVGKGIAGYSGDGDLATNAKLYLPKDLIFDSNDNMYIVDSGNQRIRKVDKSTGIITTVVGSGLIRANNGFFFNDEYVGVDGGYSGDGDSATTAKLYNPEKIIFDSLGNMFITDAGNNRIRKIDKTTNIITTITGGGTSLLEGAKATDFKLDSPEGITLDRNGNIYFTESNNHKIRKIDTNGIITTFAGTGVIINNGPYSGSSSIGISTFPSRSYSGDGGQATNAQLSYPKDLIFDKNGDMFIVDSSNHRIRKVTFTPTVQP